ncbi:hypothetical protein [Halorussus caseinilyticus]|uniref:Uncharacterized protein n=1 Tax=Halorussus caseinilyticus TaxID=3034025 RepID=A0ABD5WJ76_9EURY|nr:hypothetical protein [Halorussus sp. DT72]
MTDRTPFSPRKPVTLGSFLVVALVASALFVPTFSAHLAVMNKVSIDATATDVAVSDDGDHLVVQIAVRNPTRSAFTATHGRLYARADGEQVSGFGNDLEEATVPAGETRTVTARLSIDEDHREQAIDAARAGEVVVTGQLQGTIQDAEVEVGVEEETDG